MARYLDPKVDLTFKKVFDKPSDKAKKAMQELWMKFLTEVKDGTTDVCEDILNNPETAEALDILEQSGYTDDELAAYEQQLLNEITERSVRENLLEKGRAEGIAEAEAKAHEEKLASALAIYKSGSMPLEQIAAIMKLDAGELAEYAGR